MEPAFSVLCGHAERGKDVPGEISSSVGVLDTIDIATFTCSRQIREVDVELSNTPIRFERPFLLHLKVEFRVFTRYVVAATMSNCATSGRLRELTRPADSSTAHPDPFGRLLSVARYVRISLQRISCAFLVRRLDGSLSNTDCHDVNQ